MKSYNAETVDAILSETQPEGFRIYDRYLLGDYFFILAFGSLQLMLTKIVYKRKPKDLLFKLTLLIPILRGIFDLFENSLLLYTLKTYPTLHPAAIVAQLSRYQGWLQDASCFASDYGLPFCLLEYADAKICPKTLLHLNRFHIHNFNLT